MYSAPKYQVVKAFAEWAVSGKLFYKNKKKKTLVPIVAHISSFGVNGWVRRVFGYFSVALQYYPPI